jgi:hypothetical protein
VLRITDLEPIRGELLDTERASEESTTVAHWLQINEPRISQVRCLKSHEALVELHSRGRIRATTCLGDLTSRKIS